MPYDLRIIHSREFVQLDAEGHFDMHGTRQLLRDAIWACVHSKVGCVMVDVREATADLTVGQLVTLAKVCYEISPPPDHHRIAILTHSQERLVRASQLASLTRDGGWNICAFDEFEHAFGWLIT